LVFACLSSAGLPGLNGFVGEYLCLSGLFEYEGTYARRMVLTALGASGMFLGAWYLFTMTRRLLFGPPKEPHHEGHAVEDLTPREWGLLLPLVLLCFVVGLYPAPMLNTTAPDVEKVASIAERARARAGQVAARPVAPTERAEAR